MLLLPARRGLAQLFSRFSPADDGIFVLSSPDSSPVLAIHGYEGLGNWVSGSPPAQVNVGVDARELVHELLVKLGVGWRVIEPSDLESGRLERDGARVLILPMCAGLSDAACEAIRRWVDRGGAVIADLLPGTFSEHGRLRGTSIGAAGDLVVSTNPLDAVFGLTPGAKPVIAPGIVSIGGVSLPARCIDTAVRSIVTATPGATGGAGQPLWFSNTYGLGKAFYLACSFFSDYQYGPGQSTERAAAQERFASLLAQSGVVPAATVTAADARVSSLSVWVRRFGSATVVLLGRNYVVLYPPLEPDVDAIAVFRDTAHTYDVDEGTYLGYGDRLALRVGRYTFRTFTRLPYRVQRVTVAATGSRLGDRIAVSVELSTTVTTPGLHLIRIDVLDGNLVVGRHQ